MALAGTATISDDYTIGSQTLTLAAGTSSVATTLTAVDDSLNDNAETIEISASHNSAAIGAATITIADDDNAPAAGEVTIGDSSGPAEGLRVGGALSADVSAIIDSDGLDNASYRYQWLRTDNAASAAPATGRSAMAGPPVANAVDNPAHARAPATGDWLEIPGATGASYTLTAADAGKYISVRVSFTDDGGAAESLHSAAVGPVAAAPELELRVSDSDIDESGGSATVTVAITNGATFASDQAITLALAGTATTGDDYTIGRQTLTLAAGTSSVQTTVTALDDRLDDNGETIEISAAHNSHRLGAATITITGGDSGVSPDAWLARFGRTVTGQVLEAVESRLASPPAAAGVRASLAGQALPFGPGGNRASGAGASDPGPAVAQQRENRAGLGSITAWLAGHSDPHRRGAAGFGAPGDHRGRARDLMGPQSRRLSSRDFITGTSFALSDGSAEHGFASLWGRGSIASFDGREGDLAVDGEVITGLVGADWWSGGSGPGRWTAGVALGHSLGAGGWRRGGDCQRNCGGEMDATLTGLYPYGGIDLGDRLSLWASAGLGSGEITVTPEGGAGTRAGTTAGTSADLSMAMAAVGLRGELYRPDSGGAWRWR